LLILINKYWNLALCFLILLHEKKIKYRF